MFNHKSLFPLFIFGCLLAFSQGYSANSKAKIYQQQYTHLKESKIYPSDFQETDYYLVVLVDAKHLDYSNSQSFLTSFTKHPSTGNKSCNVGHAWLYLKGDKRVIEGGHSGELGIVQPKYVDGIMSLVEIADLNPARYLWESLNDGFFQEGNGGHNPTFAVKIDLTEKQFSDICMFIDTHNYPYKDYSLTKRQCASFISQVLSLVDIKIDTDVTMRINQYVRVGGLRAKLWEDQKYSSITFSSPDIVEKSLMALVDDGKAEYALPWYKKKMKAARVSIVDTVTRFPERYLRHRSTL